MKKVLKYILVVVMIQSLFMAHGQKGKVKSVADEYDKFYYVETSEVLLKVAENGYRSQEVLQKLANSFYFINNQREASRWYGELFKFAEVNNIDLDSENHFRYALALKGVEDYEKSDMIMEKFVEKNPSDDRSKSFNNRENYKETIESNSSRYINIKNLDFNTEFSDFGTAFSGDELIFASSRGDEDDEKYQWNDQPYLDLYSSFRYANGEFSKPSTFNSNINTKYHESSVAYTPDGKTMYFTRNNFYKRKAGEDDRGVNRLQMFRTSLNSSGEWSDVKPIHFNSDEYSVAHPAVNAEGSRLYFASDMDGTFGQSDIFVVNINEDGSLGEPKNLGPSINTPSQDSFPFMNGEGDLFFSTVGLPGLGGYDIYVSKGLDARVASNSTDPNPVKNIGKPFNSNKDDFAYYESSKGNGYFSSNRDGGKGDDDIYSFGAFKCNQVVKGVVRDKKTTDLLPGATVILFDATGNELEKVVVKDNAAFMFTVDCDKSYLVRGLKEKYTPDESRFTANSSNLELELNIALEPAGVELLPCVDLAKSLNIPNIYFDLDKYDIKYEAEVELQKIFVVMQQYPSMKIEIRSHTDCRASDDYNMELSENRAQATRQYLINNGIAANRLTAKGYGESQLVNNCDCEPNATYSCTELQHQQNRRSEFIISSLKGKNCED